MSINVTVNGNPVRIKRGTMVTADTDIAKKELDKRRKIRLTQVRQQSDEIAAKVRKRVQREREAQLSEIEKKGAEKLERWKMRKLLELQEQYCDSLKNLGLGHAQAAIEETHDKVIQASKDTLLEKSKQRGYQAAKRLHDEQKEKEKMKSLDQTEIHKDARDTEKSTKATSSLRKKKKKRKRILSSKSDSRNKSHSDSDFTATEKDAPDLDYYNTQVESSSNKVRSEPENVLKSQSDIPISSKHSERLHDNPKIQNKLIGPFIPGSLDNSKDSTPRSPSPPHLADIIIHNPPDTRISDRIKNRRLPPFNDIALDDSIRKDPAKVLISTGTLTDESKNCPCCYKCNCKSGKFEKDKVFPSSSDGNEMSRNVGTITDIDLFPATCDDCMCKTKTESTSADPKRSPNQSVKKCKCQCEIPSKPTVVLKGAHKSKFPDSDKVQYYDHKNRFAKNYPPAENQVHKIPESDIQVLPTKPTENELLERMERRDREAQIRGKKALEKQKIEKDYKELLEKLPVLQRQERIASLNSKTSHNAAFHMGDSRLRQQELNKQCKMEDAYEKLFPHSVTLKPKVHVSDKPFQVINTTEESAPVPFHWDIDAEQDGVTVTKDDGVITINPNVPDQTDNLKLMLEKLKKQKEMLMKEVEALPKDSNLNSIISDLEKLQSADEKGSLPSTGTPTKFANRAELLDHLAKVHGCCQKQKKKSSKQKYSKTLSTDSGDNTKRRKKIHKVHKIILQNTSTQTSPKVTQSLTYQAEQVTTEEISERVKPLEKKQTKSETVQTTHTSELTVSTGKTSSTSKLIPFDKNKGQLSEDKPSKCSLTCEKSGICEIVIKIQDDIPEINIKSPTKAKVETVDVSTKSAAEPIKQQNIILVEEKKTKEKERKKIALLDKKAESKLSWSKALSSTPPEPSSSTSYYSPPDFQKPKSSNLANLSDTKRKELLLKYIKKLLGMSRKSVENLTSSERSAQSTLSAISDPESPASLALRLLDLSLQDAEKHFHKSTSSSTLRSNSNGVRSVSFDVSPLNDATKSPENETSNKDDIYDSRLAAVAEKYQCMADQCQKRISNLAAMIEQVRKERVQILSPTFSEKETSTAYLNLPSTLGEDRNSSPLAVSGDATSDSEQEQKILNNLLLDVNINLKKLKQTGSQKSETPPSIDSDTYQRYKKLLAVGEYESSKSDESAKGKVVITETSASESPDPPYIPIIDIPKLPKFVIASLPQNGNDDVNKPKKPPPAKGLSAAKKFNEDIMTTPHELSTIVEVDSQLSTKASSPQKGDENVIVFALPPLGNDKNISEESMPDIVAEIKDGESSSAHSLTASNDKQQTDQSISSEMDNLEAMLVSMGMSWAVATLRKTQEALLKAASSTSSEEKPKNITDSSTSDVTLRDILGKKLFGTSSTQSSSQSLSPFIRDLEDISAIQGSGLSAERTNQRTSTPVNPEDDKSSDKYKKKKKKVEIVLDTDSSSKLTDKAFRTVPDPASSDEEKKS